MQDFGYSSGRQTVIDHCKENGVIKYDSTNCSVSTSDAPIGGGFNLMTINNESQYFNFNGNAVRVIMINGEPWWVARDVSGILGLVDGRKSIELLDGDDRKIVPVTDALGRNQDSYVINESGLYTLVLRSDKPEVKAFSDFKSGNP